MTTQHSTTDLTSSYTDFLATKRLIDLPSGIDVALDDLSPVLFPFQRALVRWALRRGRAALFADTGLGKTVCQLAYAQHVPGDVLILAPLGVTHQTIAEAHDKLNLEVQYIRRPTERTTRICITNYDLLEHFLDTDVTGIVLDESSCLKGLTSQRRKLLFAHFTHIPFRLCCTATPSPNDISEMGMHSQFLGVLTREAMLVTFFVHGGGGSDTSWHLMPHARDAFYRWLASWAMALRNPADLGYDGTAFVLPPLHLHTHFLAWDDERLIADGDGQMGIPGLTKLHGIHDRIAVRQQTVALRCAEAARLARATEGPLIIWCGLNEEGTILKRLLANEDCREVKGSDTLQWKEATLLGFARGEFRILVTKGSIAGHGLNFQHAHTAIVCGMNDSQEIFYQLVRRVWRYGQTQPVDTHIVLSEQERPIWDNVRQKEREASRMITGLIAAVKTYEQEALGMHRTTETAHSITTHQDDGWTLHHGDCVEGLHTVPDHSLHLTIYSPPFQNLFQYDDSPRDMGNTLDAEEFFTHHGYCADELKRVMAPGRIVAMHVMQVPAMLAKDGWIGLKDFRGQMIAHMVEKGFIYAGEVTCAKSPQFQAIRIRAKGLAFQQIHKDSTWARPCLGDYIILFRTPGENLTPVVPDIDNATWIIWAANIWLSTYYDNADGYRETYTLNVQEGRDVKDTKHICPLPLDLVERLVRLYSNPGETVCDPFSGLGTVGVKALEHGRQYVGCELKDSYVQAQRKNLARAMQAQTQEVLFR